MLHALSLGGDGMITSPLYAITSCAFSVVPALSGQYCVTLPDPGELGRALAGEDEIIFSVPRDKVEVLAAQLQKFEKMKFGYQHHAFGEMRLDFPMPEFYKNPFRECGLDADDIPGSSSLMVCECFPDRGHRTSSTEVPTCCMVVSGNSWD
jgi:hypothetical protein